MSDVPFPDDVRRFVNVATWRFAKTYAATWPHEYVVQNAENAAMLLALARHIFEHGTEGRFYSHVRKYHHEGGKVYWSMDETPESTTLVNRCGEDQTYEARLAAGTLPQGGKRLPVIPAFDEREGIVPLLKTDPGMDAVRADPAFRALFDRLGLP